MDMKQLAQHLAPVGPDYGSANPGMQGGQMILPKPQISSPMHGPFSPGMVHMAQEDHKVLGGKHDQLGNLPAHPMKQLAAYLTVNGTNPGNFMRGGNAQQTSYSVGYGGTTGQYGHTLGQLGPGVVPDTQTVAQRGGGLVG